MSRAPYVFRGVKYIDLAYLAPFAGLATCNNQNSDQEQQFLDMAEKLKQIPKNTQTSSDNGKTIGALKVSQTQAAEGVETKITALSTRLDKQSGDTTPLCPSLSSLSLTDTTIHKSVLDAKHTVGFLCLAHTLNQLNNITINVNSLILDYKGRRRNSCPLGCGRALLWNKFA